MRDRPPSLALATLAAALALSACATFPEVDRAESRLPPGPAPVLIPLDAALAQAGSARATEGDRDSLLARAAALRARAAAMRGS